MTDTTPTPAAPDSLRAALERLLKLRDNDTHALLGLDWHEAFEAARDALHAAALAATPPAPTREAAPVPQQGAEIGDEELAEMAVAAGMDGMEGADDDGPRMYWEAWDYQLLTFARAVWARAQGASPGAEVVAEISDEELLRTYGLAKRNHCYEGPIDDWPKRAERAATVCGLRAVLARYARPAIQPVPVSERLPIPATAQQEPPSNA